MSYSQSIVDIAKSVATAMEGKPYRYGGDDETGFDCSGFVRFVLIQAHPEFPKHDMTAAGIVSLELVEPVTAPSPGDLIFFPRSPQNTSDHIGIVISGDGWIGSQSSTGVAKVRFSNPYWSARAKRYYRCK